MYVFEFVRLQPAGKRPWLSLMSTHDSSNHGLLIDHLLGHPLLANHGLVNHGLTLVQYSTTLECRVAESFGHNAIPRCAIHAPWNKFISEVILWMRTEQDMMEKHWGTICAPLICIYLQLVCLIVSQAGIVRHLSLKEWLQRFSFGFTSSRCG